MTKNDCKVLVVSGAHKEIALLITISIPSFTKTLDLYIMKWLYGRYLDSTMITTKNCISEKLKEMQGNS